MWIAVTARFSGFNPTVNLTTSQVEDGTTKQQNVCWELNRAFYDAGDLSAHSLLVGSWGKQTATRPPRDIDLFFNLPADLYHDHLNMPGNGQSALLQKVRNSLRTPFPQTQVRADGQVVAVAFNTVTIEVVPCFESTDGSFLICDTNDGGRFKPSYPREVLADLETSDLACSRYLRPLIRMLKIWKRECNVPLHPYILEKIVSDFFL